MCTSTTVMFHRSVYGVVSTHKLTPFKHNGSAVFRARSTRSCGELQSLQETANEWRDILLLHRLSTVEISPTRKLEPKLLLISHVVRLTMGCKKDLAGGR